MRKPLQQVVSSESYVALTGADRMRHRLACGHDVTRDKPKEPKGQAPKKLRCDTCPTAGGRRPGAGRPRAKEPRSIKCNVALTEREAKKVRAMCLPRESLGVAIRRLALLAHD